MAEKTNCSDSVTLVIWVRHLCSHYRDQTCFFSCINAPLVLREMLKTKGEALGFPYLPWDLANVDALKKCLIAITV